MSQELKQDLQKIVKVALAEDCVFNDVTSDLTIPENSVVSFKIVAREEIIFCGEDVILEVFLQLKKSAKFKDSKLNLKISVKDGNLVKSGKSIASGEGDAKLIFAAERVILNLIQHLSGVATITKKFTKVLNSKKIKILDTRKTLPGLRNLQKYAVLAGGGKNHRLNLSDLILIKDNHIAAAGSVKTLRQRFALLRGRKLKTEIECDNFKQVAEVLEMKPDIIMLDNMSVAEIKKCAKLIRQTSKEIQIEISGGVNLANIKNFSGLDVDFISIGSLTHSVKAVDIGLDIL